MIENIEKVRKDKIAEIETEKERIEQNRTVGK
jgi:hypothetical protein